MCTRLTLFIRVTYPIPLPFQRLDYLKLLITLGILTSVFLNGHSLYDVNYFDERYSHVQLLRVLQYDHMTLICQSICLLPLPSVQKVTILSSNIYLFPSSDLIFKYKSIYIYVYIFVNTCTPKWNQSYVCI